MRIRTIKPEFWTNDKIARCKDFSKLLAIALLNFADDAGIFVRNTTLMRGNLFPYEPDEERIRVGLLELAEIGFIEWRPGSDGRDYGIIPGFRTHQRINRPNPSKHAELLRGAPISRTTQCVLTDGREGKGRE
jgi:hypothetical protein